MAKRTPETTRQQARTPHVCSICGRTIQPGEYYTRRVHDRHNGQVRFIKRCEDDH